MYVDTLVLEDFRNYGKVSLELSEGLNLVVGRNAQGKTNLLEAVYCLSGFGSPRSPDQALVREGAERAQVHATVVRGTRKVEVDMEFGGRKTRALVNKNATRSVRALNEVLVSVFFGPDELSLVKGSPDGRRRFLDELVVKLRPARDALRREWEKVLRQRNALLRSIARDRPRTLPDELVEWDQAFCRAGAAVGAARLRALSALLPFASKRYSEVAGGGALDLHYKSSWVTEDLAAQAMADGSSIDEETLASALAARVAEVKRGELERGMSLAGPGRDDVVVTLQTSGGATSEFLDARTYASQGDQRTAALALKLAEHDQLTEALDDPPVLLLDDVFSELDPKRREWLREAVRGAGQTVLSSAETRSWRSVEAEVAFFIERGSASRLDDGDGGS